MVQLESVINSLPELKQVKKYNGSIQLFYPVGTANMESINRHCFNNGITLSQLQLKKKSLETKFIELTN
jgi:ABC-2 type transport system ATP-binding protein